MMKKFVFVFIFFSVALAKGQDLDLNKRRDSLLVLKQRFKKDYETQISRARTYAEEKKTPLSYRNTNGNLVLMTGMDDAITPRYVSVYNAGAAITTGAAKLHQGGGLGLDLEGEGMTVGVWDEGSVLTDHVEFNKRIVQTQGASLSDHSTHVTGTIMASGVNPNAEGMAPQAKVASWDFDNDLSEMASQAQPDQTSLLFSNHSYGVLTGWAYDGASWSWYGNASISTLEDYRFGFYNSVAKAWDQLAYNSPYYTICKAAGNDRTDKGSGNYPPDCNQGTGYDCISDVAVSKNIITVGAVQKVTNYTDPSSVKMSSFSSWGPTDDGRIKPDLVGAGVDLFSTFSESPTSYGTMSGTSMATPNVTGSLTLLQELYHEIHSDYIRAATLKALAIHTTKEAGTNPGPDYSFGWGLLDVEAAAQVILQEDGENIIIEEKELANGQTMEFNLGPVEGKKITATIVWQDPAGTPVSAGLDPSNLMLVNDLDIKIVDSGTDEYYPWILNPLAPAQPASKGDNFRDNVEKIEFENPQPRPYKLIVSHKGQLQGGSQSFSLIITYTSSDDHSTAYYWVGGSGDWSDTTHWALMSGGTSAGVVPTVDDRVFFDENSFKAPADSVSFTQNAECASITWFADENVTFLFGGNTLSIGGSFIVTSSKLTSVGSGKMIFTGYKSDQNKIALMGNMFSDVDFEFKGASSWTMEGLREVRSIMLTNGQLHVTNQDLTLKQLIVSSELEKTLDLDSTLLRNVEKTVIDTINLVLSSNSTKIYMASSSNSFIDWSGVDFGGQIIVANTSIVDIQGDNQISGIVIDGEVHISGNNTFTTFTVASGATIKLDSNVVQKLSLNTTIASNDTSLVTITSVGSENAKLIFTGHYLLCFDYLIISNVDVQGDAIVNVGTHSKLINAQNWYTSPCDSILFSNFSYQDSCVFSLTHFQSLSTGNINNWLWDFGDMGTEEDISTDENPDYIYKKEGTYVVSLTVSDGINTKSYSKEITVGPNDFDENYIVLSGGKLYSYRTAISYQWYKDKEMLLGSTARSLGINNQEGSYFVVTQNSGCNRVSDLYSYIVTSVNESEKGITVYPNPVDDVVYVNVYDNYNDYCKVYVYDIVGNIVNVPINDVFNNIIQLKMKELSNGMYLLHIVIDGTDFVKKIVVAH